MDLLLISRCPPFPLHLGDRLIPFHLAQQLASRNYHIDLIAFYDSPDDLADVPRYERLFRGIQLIRQPSRSAFDYVNRALNPALMFPTRAEGAWSPEMWQAIDSRLRANRYDIVELFGGIQVSEYRNLAQQMPNIIVPYESYSLFLKTALSREPSLIRRVQLDGAKRFEKRMFEGFDRVVVLTKDDADAINELSPELTIQVIPNEVDSDYLTPTGYEPEDPTLMFIGNYGYAPNVDAALWLAQKIFPPVKRRVPKARLLLVGANPPASLRAIASKDISVTGRVPDTRPYWEQALIFVCPLRFGAGIKNKLLEAMAMQKPIVASPLSISGIAMQPEMNLLQADTVEEYYNAIIRLMKDPVLRRDMGRANRALIESRYTWRRIADQYEDLFKQVITARGYRM